MPGEVRLVNEKTREIIRWQQELSSENDEFAAAKLIVRQLGAHIKEELVLLGFWTPELNGDEVDRSTIRIEIFTPLKAIDLSQDTQEILFRRDEIIPLHSNDYTWAVVEGMKVGSKNEIGSFYWGTYKTQDGNIQYFHDVVAYSMPFGLFAPVELYDITKYHKSRSDRHYFENLQIKSRKNSLPQFSAPVNILEIHIGTASRGGTVRGLTNIYRSITTKIEKGIELDPFEQNYVGYDAIQFMPIEPIVEPKHVGPYWDMLSADNNNEVNVRLTRPDICNWGYDIVIHGSSAINPVILETGRPDEWAELCDVLLNFPDGPIMPIFDLVFGHASNQGLELLTPDFFTGPNMYGQDMNFQHPVVRAIMLEMQRRKVNMGATGVRIDGAQDFKYWDTEKRELVHDDEYLQEMSDIIQEIAGIKFYPWMIFEDGRPWPRDDWELASSYRSVIANQPNIFQWGPITFAHNTPFVYTFWVNKFWRIREIIEFGSNWLSGCSNHDTLRRGAQVNPADKINSQLGDNLQEIIEHAYLNEAQNLFFYLMMPGVPMDFLNANMRTPWLYFRNNDDHYGVKVVAEEYRFMDWRVNEEIFDDSDNLVRIKQFGFDSYNTLFTFMYHLNDAVNVTDYNLPMMARLLKTLHPNLDDQLFTEDGLKEFGWAFMDDMYELCNVSGYFGNQDAEYTQFYLETRQFRRKNRWLMDDFDFDRGEYFDYRFPTKGNAIFYGYRRAPDDWQEQFELLFIANMEGAKTNIKPKELPIPNLPQEGWEILFTAPSVKRANFDQVLQLDNSEGVVFIRLK